MRTVFMTVLALLVFSGGATGLYGSNAAHAASEKKDGEGGGYEVVELSPLILPIVGNNGLSQTVSMVIALEVEGASAANDVKQLEPRIKSAYIKMMYGMLSKQAALNKGGVIQISSIKKRLNRINHDMLGEGAVHDVLLKVVQQRPI